MNISRRQFALGALGSAISTRYVFAAPPPDRVVRVGTLISGTPARWSRVESFVAAALRSAGYVEGKNLVLERRFATFPDRRMGEYAAEFAGGKVDLIFSTCSWGASLAGKATRSVPIVTGGIGDPVALGLAQSLTRPGRNITGQLNRFAELGPKMFEMLRLVAPDTLSIGLLGYPANPQQIERARQIETAAQKANIKVTHLDMRELEAERRIREQFRDAGIDALIGLPDNDVIWKYIDRLTSIASEMKLPTMFSYRDMLDHGALMTYGPDQQIIFQQAALQLDRIVNGANPAEMPIEHPTKLEFAINVRKAAQLGISIPRAALLRADTVL